MKLKKFLQLSILITGVLYFCAVFADNIYIYGGPFNINFGTVDPFGGDQQQTMQLCVYEQPFRDDNDYAITATGDSVNNRFVMRNVAGQPLAYAVEWQGEIGGYVQLVNNVTQNNIKKVRKLKYCQKGRNNAAIRITVASADLQAAHAGQYSGTLTLLLTESP